MARANPPEPHPAIELGRRALEAYSSGAFDTARRDFAAAEQVAHSPVFVLYLARCDRALGKLLSARVLLRAVTAENLSPESPSPWRLAVSSAEAELAALSREIPSIQLTLAAPFEVSGVMLDDEKVDVSSGEVELELDPGPHRLHVAYLDGTAEQRSIHAERGERGQPIEVSEGAAPIRASAPTAPPSYRVESPPQPEHHYRTNSSLRTWSYVALGAGAASLVAGVISGATALAQIEDVKSRCSNELKCRPEDRSQVESASDWAAVSTLSFIAAGGFLTIGTSAFFLSGSAGKNEVALAARGSF